MILFRFSNAFQQCKISYHLHMQNLVDSVIALEYGVQVRIIHDIMVVDYGMRTAALRPVPVELHGNG